jgi:hypothetical protein
MPDVMENGTNQSSVLDFFLSSPTIDLYIELGALIP